MKEEFALGFGQPVPSAADLNTFARPAARRHPALHRLPREFRYMHPKWLCPVENPRNKINIPIVEYRDAPFYLFREMGPQRHYIIKVKGSNCSKP